MDILPMLIRVCVRAVRHLEESLIEAVVLYEPAERRLRTGGGEGALVDNVRRKEASAHSDLLQVFVVAGHVRVGAEKLLLLQNVDDDDP